ncbi:MAG: glutamine synthetase [Solirubrobacterales bacterium]|nr:glutamine synthetase [Solirubrobacterales bacterium]
MSDGRGGLGQIDELEREAEFALRSAKTRGVRFVRLWFVDVLGLLKSVAVPVAQLENALVNGVGIDGSCLDGALRGQERDVIAVPDPGTFQVLPWAAEADAARMFCELRAPDGSPSPGDSRYALSRQLAVAAELGYVMQVGAEIEFFLFEKSTDGAPPTPLDSGSYFDLTPLDAGTPFRRATIEHLEQMGIPVKASHHEAAPSQHEVDLEHTDALSMADAITTFRLAVKEVAQEGGAYATFMPKPLAGEFGSGLHLHLSLFVGGHNAFFDEDPDTPLSPEGRAFLAGVLAHAREFTAVTNQWTNSYKRLVPGFEAPESAVWTLGGRSSLVRVPSNRPLQPGAARIELRSPDPGCNPYLALACILAAGLRGIERGYLLPPADETHPATPALPRDLREATVALAESELVREALGDRLVDALVRNKLAELEAERATITESERALLLRLL